MSHLTTRGNVKKFARALIDEGRRESPILHKTTQIGEDFLDLVERTTREFIETQVKIQRRQKRLGDPKADLTAAQRAAMKPRKRRRR